MATRQPKYSKEESQRLGEELYERSIRPSLASMPPDHCVAIDVDSGDFEVDEDLITAVERLRERRPEAQVWLRRVDSRSMMRLGGVRTR